MRVAVRETQERYGGSERRLGRAARAVRQPPAGDRRAATSDIPRSSTLDLWPSEASLVRLWSGQRFPASALVTRQGVPLRVLHPGRRGRGAGPDFRDALIAAPSGALLRGDVELHVRASGFRGHGHHRDRRYDGVVLHVVFEDDVAEDTLLASGGRAPVVALAPWVSDRAQELAAWLSHPSRWREPCHGAVARLGPEEVLRELAELGDRRFGKREASLAAAIESWGRGEALYRALLAGLGYGGDRRLLESVAETLPWRELSARLASVPAAERSAPAEALLLGAAGLVPSPRGTGADQRRETRLEERRAASKRGARRPLGPPPVGAPPSVRPANHPARRLAGLAQLLVRHASLVDDLAAPDRLLDAPVSRLVAAWSVPAQGCWWDHAGPGVATARLPGALIGRSRAIELLVNAVLPWMSALAESRGDPEGAARARTCFARLPRPGRYGALAFLEANLQAEGGRLPLDARRQQGLLALYKTECTQAGCGRCPLS